MPTILDFQIQPISAESYSLTVCERDSSQPLATSTFQLRVDFLTDFSVDRLNASTQDAGDRFDKLKEKGQELYRELFTPNVQQVWNEYKQRSEFLILCLRFADEAAKQPGTNCSRLPPMAKRPPTIRRPLLCSPTTRRAAGPSKPCARGCAPCSRAPRRATRSSPPLAWSRSTQPSSTP